MATETRPGARSKSVQRSAVEQTEEFLQQLPKKEKDHVSLQEAIGNIADSIREALSKGHSYDEVAGLLSEQFGVSVSAWSLKRYLSLGSKQTEATKTAPKKGRRQRKSNSESDLAASTIESNGQVPAVAVAPLLTVVPDLATAAPAPETTTEAPTKTRKARTPRTPKADAAASKGRSSAAKIKPTGRKAKAKPDAAPKTGRRKAKADEA